MKKHLLGLLLISQTVFTPFAMATSFPAASGIPVFDAQLATSNLKQWAEKLKQWEETARHYKDQMSAYERQIMSQTGIRNVQAFVTQAKSAYQDVKKLYGDSLDLYQMTTSKGPLSAKLLALYDKYGDFAGCESNLGADTANNEEKNTAYHYTDSNNRSRVYDYNAQNGKATTGNSNEVVDLCKKQAMATIVQVEQSKEMQKKITDTISDINELAERVAKSQDAKEAQDLANTIRLRSMSLTAMTTLWQAAMAQNKAQAEIFEKQREEAFLNQQLEMRSVDFSRIGK